MSSRSRQTSRGVKGAKGKAATRRAPVKQSDTPILAIVVGVVLAAIFIGLIIYGAINSRTNPIPTVQGSGGSIPCDQLEHTQVHYHAALQIMYQGSLVNGAPGGTGIQGGETAPSCFYWLHVHSANHDVIHIESTADRVFTLGDFIKVWAAFNSYNNGPSIRLDSSHATTFTLKPGESIVTYIDLGDGKGPTVYDGDPNAIVLKSHETVTIEIVSSQFPAKTPPTFDWKSSANNGL